MPDYKPIPTLTELQVFWFWSRVYFDDSCWIWRGVINRDGYGQYNHLRAHRIAFALLRGPFDWSLTLDHLCRNRSCVNPRHMEPVPNGVNSMRGESVCAKHARQTHCKYGHELTISNVIRRKGSPRRRECRTCYNQRMRVLWHQGRRKRGRNG